MRKFATLAVAVFAVSSIAIVPAAPAMATTEKTPHASTKSVEKKSTTKKNTKSKKRYTVKAGDTLETIAKRFHTNYPRLFAANPSITNPDVIDVGDVIRIPGKKEKVKKRALPSQVAQQAVQPVATETTSTYTTTPVNSNSYYVGNGMWCTDYVHSKRPDVAIYGNAGYNWISAAENDGKATGSTPKKGAIAVTNGHVAYVEKVNSDGSYQVSEMGWNYQAGNYNERTVTSGEFGKFIY